MPANASEVEEAREEGLKVEFLVQPLAVGGRDGAASRPSSCSAASSASPTSRAAASRSPIEGSEFELAGGHRRLRRRPGARRRLRPRLRRPAARGRPDLRGPRHDDDDPRRRVRRRRRRRRWASSRPSRPWRPAAAAPPRSTTSCAASACCRCGTTSARSRGPATRSSPPSRSGSACPMAMVDGLRAPRRLERGEPRLHGRAGHRRGRALPRLRRLQRVRLLRARLPVAAPSTGTRRRPSRRSPSAP